MDVYGCLCFTENIHVDKHIFDVLGIIMNDIYKIETFCDAYVTRIAEYINKSGGRCIVRGWAILTDHIFSLQETQKLFFLVSKTTDDITDDDIRAWLNVVEMRKVA